MLQKHLFVQTMCFHLGMTEAFVWDYGQREERFTDWAETTRILNEIHEEFVKDEGSIQYAHHVSWAIALCWKITFLKILFSNLCAVE